MMIRQVFELFSEFDGTQRDHYADQKKDSFQIDLCGQDIRISQDGRLQVCPCADHRMALGR